MTSMISCQRFLVLLIVALASLAASPSSRAQIIVPDDVIEAVVVQGNQRIDTETIGTYLTLRVGDPFDPLEIERSFTALFRTGLFADVSIRRDVQTLIVQVVENPIINRIAFEGNQRIENARLEAEIQLRPRVVYTRSRVQADVERLLEVYRRSGRFGATINPQVIQLEQNRVDLVFEIDEGALTTIRSISFIGNEAFSDGDLREEILSEEASFLNFLASNDTYDPDRLAVDRELLRRFYLAEGYADFRVISAVAELTPDGNEFFVTFTIEEGQRYSFGNIDVVTQIPDLDPESLLPVVVEGTDDYYSSESIEDSIDALTLSLADQQFAFVEVTPRISRDRENSRINVTYEIQRGDRVYVERIEISGNVRTVDSVIRREFDLIEGDPFSATRMNQATNRIRALGFFGEVNVENVPGSTPDRTVIRVDVEEQSTGELSVGAGFSTVEGPLAQVALNERNLLGRGYRLRVAALISAETQEFDFSFTDPYFLDSDISAGFDLFRITRDNQDESSFDEFTVGFALRAGYDLGPDLRHNLFYRLESVEISDVASTASLVIRLQDPERVTSSVGHTLTLDRRNRPIRPTEGYLVSLGNEFAGVGGDSTFLRSTVRGSIFFPIYDEDIVLNIRGEAGHVFGIGEDVQISDRYFIGGNNFRGFDSSGVGPRDLATGDALGGNTFAVGSVEVAFPLGLPEEFGIRGRAFTDVGILTGVDTDDVADQLAAAGVVVTDEASLRVSVGAGISWDSPFGPVNLDLGFPVVSEDFDVEETFRFSFGTTF